MNNRMKEEEREDRGKRGEKESTNLEKARDF